MAKVIWRSKWREAMVCGLGAYFDESYGPDRSITAVAACVSPGERWDAFEPLWKREMAPWGGRPFHAVEWEEGKKGHGAFASLASLSAKELRRKERRLRWLVDTHVQHFVLEAVIEADYRAKIASRVPADEPVYRDSYHFCMFGCLTKLQVAKRNGLLPLVPVTCFFERRDKKRIARWSGTTTS